MEKRTNASVDTLQPSVMYCNNCGGKGHLFRMCKDPVLSCGILLIDSGSLPVKSQNVNLLMIRRKDSMSFTEFIRGKYDINNKEYIKILLKNMTLKEQALIASEPFEVLWKMVFGDDRASPDFIAFKDRFNKLDRVSLMKENLSDYTEPEWGFPKGRRMRGETDQACAIREFTEETNIPREAYVLLNNIALEETFTGLNNVQYRHIYFVALLKHPELINLKQKFTTMQRREISGIGWKNLIEVDQSIRPHYIERRNMLKQLASILETFMTEP